MSSSSGILKNDNGEILSHKSKDDEYDSDETYCDSIKSNEIIEENSLQLHDMKKDIEEINAILNESIIIEPFDNVKNSSVELNFKEILVQKSLNCCNKGTSGNIQEKCGVYTNAHPASMKNNLRSQVNETTAVNNIQTKSVQKKIETAYRKNHTKKTLIEATVLEKEIMSERLKEIPVIEIVIGLVETRVAKWLSGSDANPPTREQAIVMLEDIQNLANQLDFLQEKTVERKYTKRDTQKSTPGLLERSKKLVVMIDKAISEADRLMELELSEIDSENINEESNEKSSIKEVNKTNNSIPKPILKYNSNSVSSKGNSVMDRKHISFSDDVKYHTQSSTQHTSHCWGESSCEDWCQYSQHTCGKKVINEKRVRYAKMDGLLPQLASNENMMFKSTDNFLRNQVFTEEVKNVMFRTASRKFLKALKNNSINAKALNHVKQSNFKTYKNEYNIEDTVFSDKHETISNDLPYVSQELKQHKNIGLKLQRYITQNENLGLLQLTSDVKTQSSTISFSSDCKELEANTSVESRAFNAVNKKDVLKGKLLINEMSMIKTVNKNNDNLHNNCNTKNDNTTDLHSVNREFQSKATLSLDQKNFTETYLSTGTLPQLIKGILVKNCSVKAVNVDDLYPQTSAIKQNFIINYDVYNNINDIKLFSQKSTKENSFSFSEAVSQKVQLLYDNFTITNVKGIKIKDSSEYLLISDVWNGVLNPDWFGYLEQW